jgi:hypothetical protein
MEIRSVYLQVNTISIASGKLHVQGMACRLQLFR